MEVRRLRVPPFEALDSLLPGRGPGDLQLRDTVAQVLETVAAGGDAAVREFTRRFDGVDLPLDQCEVPRAEWRRALDRLAPELRKALSVAAARVRAFEWLGARGLAPAGYDPLASRQERRAALDAAMAAAAQPPQTRPADGGPR